MRKKQNISKEEAIILLQSQPLSANLWMLASDKLSDNTIRFPDPSYLDSQTWPEYMEVKKKNGGKPNGKPEKIISQKEEPVINKTDEIDEVVTGLNIPDYVAAENIQKEETKNEKVEEKTEETIQSNIEEVELNKVSSTSKRKSKKQEEEIQFEKFSTDVVDEVKTSQVEKKKTKPHAHKSLDFYEWLEELKTEEKKSSGKRKARTPRKKPNTEITDAKTDAEKSLKLGDEIVSETLARLLARQGHKEEAIEMYEKLILKYPEKGATFAAALQKLKS